MCSCYFRIIHSKNLTVNYCESKYNLQWQCTTNNDHIRLYLELRTHLDLDLQHGSLCFFWAKSFGSILFILQGFIRGFAGWRLWWGHRPPFPPLSNIYIVDWLVELEELLNFGAPAFPEVRSALAANRDLIDGPSPVSVLSLPLLRPGVCCKIGL